MTTTRDSAPQSPLHSAVPLKLGKLSFLRGPAGISAVLLAAIHSTRWGKQLSEMQVGSDRNPLTHLSSRRHGQPDSTQRNLRVSSHHLPPLRRC